MRRIVLFILCVGITTTALAWFTPDRPVQSVFISRIGGFLVVSDNYTNTVDWGTNGMPLQVEVSVNDWEAGVYPITSIVLQYATGSVANASTDWTTINQVVGIKGVNLQKRGTHLGWSWTPPNGPGLYLLRLYVVVFDNVSTYYTSADVSEAPLTAAGGTTWDNWEIVGVVVRNNSIPGR